jgi:hypothetical protein
LENPSEYTKDVANASRLSGCMFCIQPVPTHFYDEKKIANSICKWKLVSPRRESVAVNMLLEDNKLVGIR